MGDLIEIKIKKDDYYILYINGKKMPEYYNRQELIDAIDYFTKIWSNTK